MNSFLCRKCIKVSSDNAANARDACPHNVCETCPLEYISKAPQLAASERSKGYILYIRKIQEVEVWLFRCPRLEFDSGCLRPMRSMRASQVHKLRISVGPSQKFSIASAAYNHHCNLLQLTEKGWSGYCWGS